MGESNGSLKTAISHSFVCNNFNTRLNQMKSFNLLMESSFTCLQLLMGMKNGPKPLLGWKQLFHTLFLTNNFSTRLNPMQNFILPMECSFSSLQLLMGLRNGPKPLFGWKQLFQTQFLTNKFSTGPNWIIITPLMNTCVRIWGGQIPNPRCACVKESGVQHGRSPIQVLTRLI